MKAFIQECGSLLKAVIASPFTEFGRDALDGLGMAFLFLFCFTLSLVMIATFPVSIPLVVLYDRRSKRLEAKRREEFSARILAELHKNGVDLG